MARPAAAANHLIAIDEVLGSWQGDDRVQFVELRLLAAGQQFLSAGGGAHLVFDDATASAGGERTFDFHQNLASGAAGDRVLIGTAGLATVAGVALDFVLPDGWLAPRAGRVCYRVDPPQQPFQTTGVVDCVAYGKFTGENGSFGPPTPLTPDDRALQRVDATRLNVDDWGSVLQPTPQSNAGLSATLATSCGDGVISQGEECDGAALGGQTCASLGFATGTIDCVQCHFDTRACSFCGNGAINGREECDGADVGGRTCADLGFTGGSLSCTDRCTLSTRTCDPTFFVPGGGPIGPECLAEWRVANAKQRPGADGKAPVRQKCKDGDVDCDTDLVRGTCTFALAVCFDRADARLARGGHACRHAPIEAFAVLNPPAGDATAGLVTAAVAGLGPSTTSGGVATFAPPLDTSERCTEVVPIVVPVRGTHPGTLVLRTRTAGAGGRPRDVDTLKLVCVP